MERKLRNEELERLSNEEFKEAEKLPLLILLDNVRSAVNVGSVFRTADAFRIEKVLLSGITPSPDRKVRKTALGATESVDWERVEDPIEAVRHHRERGYRTHGIEQTRKALSLRDFNPELNAPHMLVLGHEVDGIGEDLIHELDDCILIEQFGTKHSLNVSVCCGIFLWEFHRKLRG